MPKFAPSYKIQPIKALKAYQKNSRTHSAAQVDKLIKSITTFGFTNPILTDDQGMIIAGHGRLMAAKKMKLTEVPTIVLTGLTDIEKRALVIADNKLALDAGWDMDVLQGELMELNADTTFDFALTGFSLDEATTMFLEASDLLQEDVQVGDGEEVVKSAEDVLLDKCRDLLKRDKGFAPIVNDRHAKMGK